MNVNIRDAAAMRAIQPADAAAYLRGYGWLATDKKEGVAARWEKSIEGEAFELWLPLSTSLSDYAIRMGELLEVLAIAEQRSQLQVYRDVMTSSSDVVRIRMIDAELQDGSLPIEEHARMAQKARELVLAAACAATETRSVWHKRKPQSAMDHLRRVRIGPSEQGSYVMTVVSRVTPLLHGPNDRLFEMDIPFDRRATQTLAEGLLALNSAAAEATLTQQMAAFENAIPQGVSANLCDAVAGLGGDDLVQRKLEFTFSWAPVRPVPSTMVRKVCFAGDQFPLIRQAARQMREYAPIPEFELSGPVVSLNRDDEFRNGTVSVFAIVEDRQVRVWMELSETPYKKAIDAHKESKFLSADGTLVKEGGRYFLRNVSEVKIHEE